MATSYDKKINRYTDWGGDASTNYLPVAGNRVQESIKEELGSKVGAFYKPLGGNYIYCFANAEDKEKYILTGDESLIVDMLETESQYTLSFNRDTLELTKSVIEGTTGNTIEFQFKIVDSEGFTADSKALIEYVFESAGNIRKYTTQVGMQAEGWTTVISDVIDQYLKLGENTITVSVQGLQTKTSAKVIITYNVFNLSFKTHFEYNTVKNGSSIEVPYEVSCSEIPINLEYYLDGASVDAIGDGSMIINEYSKEGMSNIAITGLEPGKHTLQARAYVTANKGGNFYSNTHYYAFCIGGSETPSFLLRKDLDSSQGIIQPGQDLTINITQFEEFSMKWSLYDSKDRRFVVNFVYDGKVISTPVFDTNGDVKDFSFKPLTFGDGKVLRIFAKNEDDEIIFEDQIIFNVKESPTGIKETMDRLLLKLTAIGRRNSDDNYNVWEYTGVDNVLYSATFNNFAWNKQQGWNEDEEALIISDNAYVDINIQPMLKSWHVYGGTFEIDLETFDIEDDDALICECKNDLSGSSYFRITATNAEFSTADGVKINTRFKDNEKLKIAFIGNKNNGSSEDKNLIYIVVNGVLERAQLYNEDDRISSNATLRIGSGNGGCKVKLRSIRVYDRAITVDEEFNNYVVDSPNSQIIYEKNNVIKKGTTNEIGFDEVANKLPVMIFTGNMVELMKAGQDKNWRYFDVEYINRQEPERNFVGFNCLMKLQGTSSLGYPRKNFKLKTNNKEFTEENDYYRDLYEVDMSTSTVEGNRRLIDKRTGEYLEFGELPTKCLMYDYMGQPLRKGKYRFRADSHKATKWTLKADFMESSCSHNVGAGRSWNDIFENTEFEPGNFAGYENKTYKDSALLYTNDYEEYDRDGLTYHIPRNTDAIKAQKKFVCRTDAQKICHAERADDIRTAVDGFPMVCFYRENHNENNLIFMGQYNFINDKGSFEVFGFEDIEDPQDETDKVMIYDASKVECWEGLKNANPISLFKTTDNWNSPEDGWKSTYESRYPDQGDEGVIIDSTALYELSNWLVSTRHESADTVYGDTITIDATFAKHINDYQYGYLDDNVESYYYLSGNVSTITLPDTPDNRQLKFAVEKWEHFDVWKLAGYYIYLMRYGAVDQFVKNTMLFTDGNGLYELPERVNDKKYRKWFFLNYDNDCLFGLRNNGQLAFHWDLDRQTKDGSSEIIVDSGDTYVESGTGINDYAMMGHDSTLWNNLEADDEFMRMVRDLDNSMCANKLTYENMVTEFDTKQTEMWCERIYNANEKYKYIDAAKGVGDMSGNPVNNLWMLQGTRRSHRHWWIANHFNLLDAKWLSGKYRQTYMEFKSNCLSGTTIRAVAGEDYYYAWGLQKKIYESNIVKKKDDPIEFVFPTKQSQGDPVYIYAVNKMSELDFSDTATLVYEGSYKFVIGNDNVSNTLKKLVIGNPGVNVNVSIDTSTWRLLKNLEYLDITNYKGIISLPWTYETEGSDVVSEEFKNLHVLKAFGSGLASFAPSEGSMYTLVELPDVIRTIKLNNIKFNSFANDFKYNPNSLLRTVEIQNNAGIGNTYYENLIKPWIVSMNSNPSPVSLYAEKEIDVKNISWRLNDLNDIWIFENFRRYGNKFILKGVINLSDCGALKMDDINRIKGIFGENCFNSSESSIYIITPNSIFINSENESIVAGKSNVFTRSIYPDESILNSEEIQGQYEITFAFVKPINDSSYSGETYIDYTDNNRLYAKLTNEELYNLRNRNGVQGIEGVNVKVGSKEEFHVTTREFVTLADTMLKVMACLTIGQDNKISVMDFVVKDPTYAYTGSISGEKSLHKNSRYEFDAELKDIEGKTPIGSEHVEWEISMNGYESYISTAYTENDTLRLVIETSYEEPTISETINITAHVTNGDNTTFTLQFNPLLLNDRVILTNVTNPVVMGICNRMGWSSGPNANALMIEEAESVTSLGNAFYNVNTAFTFNEFEYFTGLTEIPENGFRNSKIKEITIPKNITSIGNNAFNNCTSLSKINTILQGDVFEEYTLDNISKVNEGCFKGCTGLKKLILGDSITEIEKYAFGGTRFTKALVGASKLDDYVIILPHHVNKINGSAFETRDWSIETTDNNLVKLELPVSLNLTNNFQLLYGKNYDEFLVETLLDDTTGAYSVLDGVLYTRTFTAIVKYPAKKARSSSYEIYSFENASLSIERIYDYAFLFVENVDKVVTSQGWAQFGSHCFERSKIKEADFSISNSLTFIPDFTFKNCLELEKVVLPIENSIKTIGIEAFYNCPSLVMLALNNGIREFNYTLDESSAKIGNNFYNCGFSTFELPDTLVDMGYNSIVGFQNLTSLKMPNKFVVEEKKSYSYVSNCPNLTGITLPASSYYTNVVYNIYNEEGTLVDTASTITEAESKVPENGYYLVTGDDNIINENYNSLVTNAPSLLEFVMSDIDNGNNSFVYDGSIYTKENQFIRCPFGRETVIINEGCGELLDKSFENCRNLTGFTIPESVTEIGESVFSNCISLVSLTIPSGVTNIEYSTFFNCVSLSTLIFAGDIKTIGNVAFAACGNLKDIYIFAETAPTMTIVVTPRYHPFGDGGTLYAYAGGRIASGGENKIYVLYGASGYDEEPEDSYSWLEPVQNPSKCGYNIEYIQINGYIEVTIYQDGHPLENGYIYVTSESGDISQNTDYSVGQNTGNGKFNVPVNKLYHGETFTIYSSSDLSAGSKICDLTADYFKNEYVYGELAMSRGKVITLKSGVFSGEEENGEEEESETVTITKKEYDAIVSNLEYLNGMVNNFIKK